MARLADGQLSEHPTKGYRVSVGTYLKDGMPTPKVFWLGHNAQAAHFAAHTYRTGWTQVRACGHAHWNDDLIARAKATISTAQQAMAAMFSRQDAEVEFGEKYLRGIAEPDRPTRPNVSPRVAAGKPVLTTATLYSAIKAYLDSLRLKRNADSHKQRAQQVLEISLKRIRQDVPLSQIDFLWIDSLCDYFKGRPVTRIGKPMSPYTVKVTLQYLRQFFVWIDDASYGGWEAPRKLAKPFKLRISDIMTPVEMMEVGNIQQFDLKTLKKLYATASDFQKMIMLAALFTGATQQELAVMEQKEFDLDAGMLKHYRNKTKVLGCYWLPPELVALLRKAFKSRRKDPLAFRTSDGNALVTYKDGQKISDAVRQSWDDLRVAAKVPNALSFKYLRKFLADWMTRDGGESMGQVALSHSRQTVLARHYSSARDFETFNELQRKMHAEMTAAAVFETKVRTSVKQSKRKAA